MLRVVWTNGVPQNRLAAADRSADRGGAGPQGELPLPLRLERASASTSSPTCSGTRPSACRWRPASTPAPTPTSWCGWTAPGRRTASTACASPRSSGRPPTSTPSGSGWWTTRRTSRWRAACGWCRASASRWTCSAARAVRPVAAAWDGKGDDVTARVRARDEVYASGFEPSPYQGVARAWTFTFDLGEAPGAPRTPPARRLDLPGRRQPEPRRGPAPGPPLSAAASGGGDGAGLEDARARHGLPGGQDQDDGGGHPAAAARRPPPAHRHLPLARLGPHRLDPDAGRRRPGGPARLEPRSVRSPLPRLLGAGPPLPQRTPRLRLRRTSARNPPGSPSPATTPATATWRAAGRRRTTAP